MSFKSLDGRPVIYVAAFVESPDELRAQFANTPAAPYLNLCHHMTFKFRPNFHWFNMFTEKHKMGSSLDLAPQVLAVNTFEGIAAIGVGTNGHSTSRWVDTGVPHITLGVAPGVPPRLSTPLLRGDDMPELPKAYTEKFDLIGSPTSLIRARVGWWDGSRARFDMPY